MEFIDVSCNKYCGTSMEMLYNLKYDGAYLERNRWKETISSSYTKEFFFQEMENID